MNKYRKLSIYLLFVGILSILFGVTYSFFNYTKTGLANNFNVGDIHFNTTQNGSINLSNVFPIKSSELSTDVGNHDSVSISITGSTDYTQGIEYRVTTEEVNNKANGKRIPLSFSNEILNLGTESDDYYNSRGGNTSIYTLNEDGLIKNGKYLLVGYISSGQTGINGSITITAYIDADKILISDTYNGTGEGAMGTPVELAAGKTVFTTEEWNSFGGNNAISFKIKVEANQGTWVRDPSTDTPSECFEKRRAEAKYIYNTNRTQEAIDACADYLYYIDYGIDESGYEAFCAGTGTSFGETITQLLYKNEFSWDVLELFRSYDLIILNGYYTSIYGYNESCGREVVIPETIDMDYITYTPNSNITETELNTCVNYLIEENEWTFNTSEGETVEDYCNGTGTHWGITFYSELNSDYGMSEESIDYLVEHNIVISNSQTVSANVERIEYRAFYQKGIQSVIIPDSVHTIDKNAFKDAEMEEVVIPNSVQDDICALYAFDVGVEITQNNLTFTCGCFVTNDIDENNTAIIGYDNYCPKDVVIPSIINGKTVTSIGYSAFANQELTSVVMPNTITSIGGMAFATNKLTSIDIPNGVTTIGSNAFATNRLTSVVIPEGITQVDSSVFRNNRLTNVVFPSSVISIMNDAFANNQLATIEIPSSVKYISSRAFNNNPTTRLVIEDNLTIYNDTFTLSSGAYISVNVKNCTNLILPSTIDTLILGDKVESEPKCNPSSCTIGTLSINSKSIVEKDYTSYVPFSSKKYKPNNLVIGNNVTKIGNFFFYDNAISNLTISDSVTSIGNHAFNNNKITSLNLSDNVTSIGVSAFYNNNLASVSIGSGITSIGASAFGKYYLNDTQNSNANLASITINKSCSIIKNMTDYAWIGNDLKTGTTIYGSNNEVCDAY